jgi:hypothetical protein
MFYPLGEFRDPPPEAPRRSSGFAWDLRSKAKSLHAHTLGALRAPNVFVCKGFASERRSRASPDDTLSSIKAHRQAVTHNPFDHSIFCREFRKRRIAEGGLHMSLDSGRVWYTLSVGRLDTNQLQISRRWGCARAAAVKHVDDRACRAVPVPREPVVSCRIVSCRLCRVGW